MFESKHCPAFPAHHLVVTSYFRGQISVKNESLNRSLLRAVIMNGGPRPGRSG
eukprot:m.489133 g.489133  ORF g.489133 m.489133 type:complete len:53 (+) comp92272_c0_seq1:26-184(+)